MAPVSASLSHIFVPYPGPVALSRTPVLNPDPKKVSRADKLSPLLLIPAGGDSETVPADSHPGLVPRLELVLTSPAGPGRRR